MVHKYADEPVLVLGGTGDTIKKVAEGYAYYQALRVDMLNYYLGMDSRKYTLH